MMKILGVLCFRVMFCALWARNSKIYGFSVTWIASTPWLLFSLGHCLRCHWPSTEWTSCGAWCRRLRLLCVASGSCPGLRSCTRSSHCSQLFESLRSRPVASCLNSFASEPQSGSRVLCSDLRDACLFCNLLPRSKCGFCCALSLRAPWLHSICWCFVWIYFSCALLVVCTDQGRGF